MSSEIGGEAMASERIVNENEATRLQRWLSRRVQNDEAGLALVWMALFLIVLIGFAALAVDIGHGYQVAQKAQNTADAAALAGTVYLPTDVAGAYSAAQVVAASNGFPNGGDSGNISVVPQQQTKLSRLKVTVNERVKTWFAGAIGFKTMNVSRSAIADYNPPVAMGSPSNQYGNDPTSAAATGTSQYPNLWGNVSAAGSSKQSGDAYTSGDCTATSDNCTGTNADFDPKGYYYDVHFNSAATVQVQVFDPGFVAVGDYCEAGGQPKYDADLAAAAALTQAQVPAWPAGVPFNASQRYAPEGTITDPPDLAHPGTRYCTGDVPFSTTKDATGGTLTPINMPATSYTVLGPATVPGQPSTASPTAGCSQQVFPGVGGTPGNTIATQLQSTATVPVTPVAMPLATYFRQWYTICTITGTADSDYFLQVNGAGGQGHNRFAIRALPTTGPTTAVSLYGNGKMAIYANAGSNVLTQFYLARVPTSDAGHTLDLFLFDIGDAGAGVTGTLTIVPPDGSALQNCTYTPPPGNTTGPSWGTPSPMTNCSISGVSSTDYQGQWIEIGVPVPSAYSCNDSDPNDCWFRINYLFNGPVNDTTSWSAKLEGDPVRIVQ